MDIRKATADDFPAILTLIKKFPETIIQDHLPEVEEFFVAIDDGKMVGCCALEIYSQRLAEVRSLAVEESMQGKGIATQLVETCLAEAREKKIYEVLAITSSPPLFERQGFGTFNNEKFALFKVLGK